MASSGHTLWQNIKKRSPHTELSAQSSLSIFSQKYLLKCEDTYLILQNKYLHIYEDSFGAKIPRDDYTQNILKHFARLWSRAKELTKFDILPLSVTIGDQRTSF